MSIHFLSRTRIDTEVNVTVGFCLGLALQWVSPKPCPLLSWSASILLPTYQHHSRFLPKKRYCLQTEMEFELRYRIDHHERKLCCSRTGPILVFLRIHPLIRVLFHFEASYILGQKMLHLQCFFCIKSVELLSCFDKLQTRIRT